MLKNSSSFRDPSGFVFEHQGALYRSVSHSYAREFEFLESSGLIRDLFLRNLLVHHEKAEVQGLDSSDWFAILKPEPLELITYPYEWSFSQLKQAALLTLEVMIISLEHGMILKDASGFNIQFRGTCPVFIDTLSFAIYRDGQAWNGYRQFCEHFLAPLCLSSWLGVSYLSLQKLGVDGIPLKIASELLPVRTWFTFSVLTHIHLHARSVGYYSKKRKSEIQNRRVSKRNLVALVMQLRDFVGGVSLMKSDKTQWEDYSKEIHYSSGAKEEKARLVKEFANRVSPTVVWDLGANDGFYSRLVAGKGRIVVSMDSDPLAIEKNFIQCKAAGIDGVYPLLFDLSNPTPDMGWANRERTQLPHRSRPDLIMALAVVHHIAITHNVPLPEIAAYFQSLAEWLIIEFVSPEDEKVATLPDTAGKQSYTRRNFEAAFLARYTLVEEKPIAESGRSLMLLRRHLP